MDKLNQKQQSFVINYVRNGFNAYQAALDSGYSKTTAATKSSDLLNVPSIKERIERAVARFNDALEIKLGITLEHKAKMIVDIINEISSKEIKTNGNYDIMLKSIDMLNKMQGHYAPNRSLAVTVDATKDRLIEARKQYEEY